MGSPLGYSSKRKPTAIIAKAMMREGDGARRR